MGATYLIVALSASVPGQTVLAILGSNRRNRLTWHECNFWRHGWNAVMITDTAFYRNPNYHEVTDTPDTLDYGRMAHVVTGVYAAVTSL